MNPFQITRPNMRFLGSILYLYKPMICCSMPIILSYRAISSSPLSGQNCLSSSTGYTRCTRLPTMSTTSVGEFSSIFFQSLFLLTPPTKTPFTLPDKMDKCTLGAFL